MSTQVASKPVQVAFTNKQGTVVMLDKHKRRRYIDNDDKDMACIILIRRLIVAEVKDSTANILKLGIGAQTLYAFKVRAGVLRFKRKKIKIK